MPLPWTSGFLLVAMTLIGQSVANAQFSQPEFKEPIRMKADGREIFIEAPGYATPTWSDITGDGREDLLVGQFSSGKIQIFEQKSDGTLMAGRWLEAGGEVAQVPDVW